MSTNASTYDATTAEVLNIYCSGVSAGVASFLATQGLPVTAAEVIGRRAGSDYARAIDTDPAIRQSVLDGIDRLLDRSLPITERGTEGQWL